MNSAKFLTTPFLIEHFRWLLLNSILSFYFDKQFSDRHRFIFGHIGEKHLQHFKEFQINRRKKNWP